MTKDDLTKLDNYGHKALDSLSEDQLKEYMVLLELRLKEVADRLWQLRKLTARRAG